MLLRIESILDRIIPVIILNDRHDKIITGKLEWAIETLEKINERSHQCLPHHRLNLRIYRSQLLHHQHHLHLHLHHHHHHYPHYRRINPQKWPIKEGSTLGVLAFLVHDLGPVYPSTPINNRFRRCNPHRQLHIGVVFMFSVTMDVCLCLAFHASMSCE